jgi:hypothetical protein
MSLTQQTKACGGRKQSSQSSIGGKLGAGCRSNPWTRGRSSCTPAGLYPPACGEKLSQRNLKSRIKNH